MLGQAYRFIIFVFICGGLEILFVIAIVRVLCVGRTRMSARSHRACIGLDRHLTFWQSRSSVSGTSTEGCPSRVSSGSSRGLAVSRFSSRKVRKVYHGHTEGKRRSVHMTQIKL